MLLTNAKYDEILLEHWFVKSLLKSYSQVFFSNSVLFALILFPVTFIDFYTGLYGLVSVLTANTAAWILGLHKEYIIQGYYGFNALLTGMGLGLYFESGLLLLLIVFLAGIMSLFIAITLQGVIGKYNLPHLSLPFIITLWTLMLASREFSALGINERWVYAMNDLYIIGGKPLLHVYEWWNGIPFPLVIKSYFLSMGAIFFHYSTLGGIIITIGLLLYSRIAFTLSVFGFLTAYLFYKLIGAEITAIGYSYIGFNHILTAIAAGGFFIIPNRYTYASLLILIPLVSILAISINSMLEIFALPVYSLPFNIVILSFLYVLQFRVHNLGYFSNYFLQYNSPEKNLYAYTNYLERFGIGNPFPIHLPFFGEWTVTQAHDGKYTHKGEWKHAWDFEMKDDDGSTFRNDGDYREDYYCYDKLVISPADGVVEEVIEGILDNEIGKKNLEDNWGNTIVIKHTDYLYSKLCHLKMGSVIVNKGDKINQGDVLARCGNSGNSPYPHLHFQVQATPYIGSKTISYPISNYFILRDKVKKLYDRAIPELNDIVSNIQPHPVLKNAFSFVHGKTIRWVLDSDPDDIVSWEVMTDRYYNKYIFCHRTGSKVYLKTGNSMVYMTHFEGDKASLLYYFFLSAFKISYGFYRNMKLEDTLPVNLVFKPRMLIIQDFLAPFHRYMKAAYSISYPGDHNEMISRNIELKGSITLKKYNTVLSTSHFVFQTGDEGLQVFEFINDHHTIKATCLYDSF